MGHQLKYMLKCTSILEKRILYETTKFASKTSFRECHSKVPVIDPCFLRIDSTFGNAEEAFKSKKNSEIIRSLFVFNLCGISPLVDFNKEILAVTRKLFGKWVFEKIMKNTFYGQFVAGEDCDRIKPTILHNHAYGVKSILDYSVEMDITKDEAKAAEMKGCESSELSEEDKHEKHEILDGPEAIYRAHLQFGDRRENVSSARTYFYRDEANCDLNMRNFLEGIDVVSKATESTGFSAIKLTALGRPQLLLQVSDVLDRLQRFYNMMVASSDRTTQKLTISRFERYMKIFSIDKEETMKWITLLDPDHKGEFDVFAWENLLSENFELAKLLRVPNMKTGELEPLIAGFTKEEEDQMKNFLKRVDYILQYAKSRDVRVMIDAEQTYFQGAINRFCMEMMRKYNTEKAIVFNTYQCYLKGALNSIKHDLELSRTENFYFGCKLVRGAYMEQERLRAGTLGYPDPINNTYDDTTAMYQNVTCEVLEQINSRPKGDIAVMIASHNEDSVRYTLEKMQEYGVTASDRVICFGQLLGMSDQISFSLGQAGYSIYKYVPYGPVEEVLPYLSRRATENKGILKKVKKEKAMLWSELMNRFRKGQFFYKPPNMGLVQPKVNEHVVT